MNNTPGSGQTHTKPIVIECFNSHGFKESLDFISNRLSTCDFMCLSETWIKPSELNLIQRCLDEHVVSNVNKFIVFNKTGMLDEDEHSPGRPYGGVAIICKILHGFSYELIKCDNRRIIGVLIKDNNDNPIHLIISTYFPFYDKGNRSQTDEYIECIEALQATVDEYADSVPVKILGDFNVQLPRSCTLPHNWHKLTGFNGHSRILNDFIQGNSLKVLDHMYSQAVNYTYFNIPRKIYTWIDHILSTEGDVDYVDSCKIIPLDEHNVGDHLLIRLCIKVNVPDVSIPSSITSGKRQLLTNWNRSFNNAKYLSILSETLSHLPLLHVNTTDDANICHTHIDNHVNILCSAFINSAKLAGIVPEKRFTPKKYWCPDLSKARDTKRFWWRLWLDNGRPRDGEVFKCYKNVKKLYRKITRQCIYAHNNELYRSLDSLLCRDVNRFWNSTKKLKKSPNHASVNLNRLVEHFSSIMQDSSELSHDHANIADIVNQKYMDVKGNVITHRITSEIVDKCIGKLKRHSSPGIDGIVAEFIILGKSDILCQHLSALYSLMFTYNHVPTVFNTGVMVPILKKPTLNPNDPSNYRPITISSVFSKLLELIIIPNDVQLSSNQFGFRSGYSVANGINLLNDLACCCKHNHSNMYMCSLDAEKCFDSIWHCGLFYKLMDVLPVVVWRFLFKWYKSLDVVIKWNGDINYNSYFKVTRGTRQGSILSPILFNIFVSELMQQLSAADSGLRIGQEVYNSFAYADDISVFSSTVPGLQRLINICHNYSVTWRFKFGLSKSQCMVTGYKPHCFVNTPVWYLGNNVMNTVNSLEILGVTFTSSINYDSHIQTRVQKCKRSMYSLSNIGMCYPGLNTSSKTHLFRTVCKPSLMYGVECINTTKKHINNLNSAQGFIIKNVCGLSKRSHHSAVLQALDIVSAQESVKKATTTMYNRLCSTDSPTRNLAIYLASLYLSDGIRVPGTIVDRLVNMGADPLPIINVSSLGPTNLRSTDGVVDSLRSLLLNDNYIKPWSTEYFLVKLLTRSF